VRVEALQRLLPQHDHRDVLADVALVLGEVFNLLLRHLEACIRPRQTQLLHGQINERNAQLL